MKNTSVKKKALALVPLALVGSMVAGQTAFAEEAAVNDSNGIPPVEVLEGGSQPESTPGAVETDDNVAPTGDTEEDATVDQDAPGGQDDNVAPGGEEQPDGVGKEGKVSEGEDDYNALVEFEKAYEDAVAEEAGKERPADTGEEPSSTPDEEEKQTDEAKPFGENDKIFGGWTKAELKKSLADLNKEFETNRFDRFIKMVDEATTKEQVKAIIDEIEEKTGIIYSIDGPNYTFDESKESDGSKSDTVKPEEKGSVPVADSKSVKDDVKQGENKPVSVATPQGNTLAETGFDGGIIIGLASALGLAGAAIKRRKGEE